MENFTEKFIKLKRAAEQDIKIDINNIENVLLETNAKRQKWISTYHTLKNDYEDLILQRDKFYYACYRKKKTSSYIEYSGTKEIDNIIKNTKKYQDYTYKINQYEKLLSFINKTLENLSDRCWTVRTLVNYKSKNIEI